MSIYQDEWGHEMGYCNSCGEEAEMGQECCEDGEVVEYDDVAPALAAAASARRGSSCIRAGQWWGSGSGCPPGKGRDLS